MKLKIYILLLLLPTSIYSTELYLRPEIGISPISTADDIQYSGFQTAVNFGLNFHFLFSELGVKHSSTSSSQDVDFSTTSFHATVGLRPDDQFSFALNLYPIINSESKPSMKEYSGNGVGLSMGWIPYHQFYLNGEYRFYGLENDINEQEKLSFSEFIFSVSYLFY